MVYNFFLKFSDIFFQKFQYFLLKILENFNIFSKFPINTTEDSLKKLIKT